MKKKLLATALGMLCIGMCVGCAGKEEETTETKKYEEGPMVHTPVPDPYVEEKYQFGGKEIIIRDWWSAKGEKEPENDYEEAVEEMREWVQAEYDVVISEMALSDYSSSLDDFLDYVRSGGDDNNYIWAVYDDPRLTEAINEGLVWDLSSLGFYSDQFQFFMKNSLCEKYTMGDGVYAMNAKPDISYAGLYVNRDVLIQCGVDVDVIWTMQEEGTWNWEAFENVLAQIDASGEDVYGLVADDTFMTAAIHSNGAVLVAREGDEYVDASCTEGAHKANEWVDGIYEKYAFSLPEDEKYTDAFLGGKVAFCAGNSFDCVDYGWMSIAQIDYSFIAFPMGPDVNYYANCENSVVYVIPGCYDDGKAFEIAYAFELWMTEPGGYDEYINLKQFQKCDKSILDTMIFLSKNTKTIIDYADMVLADTAE